MSKGIEIEEIRIENCVKGCITDCTSPVISFSLKSDKFNTKMEKAKILIGGYSKIVKKQTGIICDNVVKNPFSQYPIQIEVIDNYGRKAIKKGCFMSGRLDTPWDAQWITDEDYEFSSKESPKPMTFLKTFYCHGNVKRAYITSTAIGVYELTLNGCLCSLKLSDS